MSDEVNCSGRKADMPTTPPYTAAPGSNEVYVPTCNMTADHVEALRRIRSVGHRPPPNWYEHAHEQWEANNLHRTRCVLLCMDGVADYLLKCCLQHQQSTYVLDPVDREIYRVTLRAGQVNTGQSAFIFSRCTAGELPHFDLFVSGCHRYVAEGYAYSTAVGLKLVYVWVQQSAAITTATQRIIIASPTQMIDSHDHHHPPAFMRAHRRMDGVGGDAFTWKPDRRQRNAWKYR